ncbi:MAG: Crp/Fnr family transcriptional regulator [Sneathiella sp.]
MYENFIDRLVAKSNKSQLIDPGSYLFHEGDRVDAIYIVLDGMIELVRYQQDGTSITLQRAASQSILAEASIYSELYHCDAIAKLPSRVFMLPKVTFLTLLQQDKDLSNSWAARLAREVQTARSQIEILSRKTVSERLDGWLAWKGAELPSKGAWKGIADQIGVSPEALYREIAKRRQG